MTVPTILFLTSDLRDLDVLNQEASRTGLVTFTACPAPDGVLEYLERHTAVGLLVDSALAASQRCEAISRARVAQPTLPIVAFIATGDGADVIAAGATACVLKRGSFASRAVNLFSACFDAGVGSIAPALTDVQVATFGLTPAQTAALEGAGVATFAASVTGAGLVLADGAPVDPALFDAALLSEEGLASHACEVLVDVRCRAPHLNLVSLSATDTSAFATITTRLGGVNVTATPDALPAALNRLLPLLQARRVVGEELQATRNSELRVRTVVECAPSSIVLFDTEGTCLAMNWAGLSVLGYDDAQGIVGADFATHLAPADREAFVALLRTVGAGQRHETTLACETANGVLARIRMVGAPLPRDEEGLYGVLCSIAPAADEEPTVEAAAAEVPDASAGSHDRELSELRARIEGLTTERDTLAAQARELEGQVRSHTMVASVDPAVAEAMAAEAVQQAEAAWQQAHAASVAEWHAQGEALRRDIEGATATIDTLRSQLGDHGALRDRCELLETWLHEAEDRCDELQRELAAKAAGDPGVSADDLEALRHSAAAAASEATATQTALATLTDECAQLRGELAAMQGARDDAERLIESLRDHAARAAAATASETAATQTALSTLTDECAQLRADLAAAQGAREDAERRFASMRDKAEQAPALEAALDEARQSADAREAELAELRTGLQSTLAQVATLQSDLAHSHTVRETDRLAHVSQLSQAEAQTEELEAKVVALSAALNDATAAIQAASVQQGLSDELARLEHTLAEFTTNEQALRQDLARAQRECDELKSAVEAAGVREREQEAALVRALAQAEGAQEQLMATAATSAEVSANLQQLRSEHEALAHRHQVVAAEAAAHKAAREAADEEWRSTRAATEAAEAAASQAAQATRDAEQEVERLHAALEAAHAQLDGVERVRALAEAESAAHHETANRLALREADVATATTELEQARIRIAMLEQQLAEAVRQVTASGDAHHALQLQFQEQATLRDRLEDQLADAHRRMAGASSEQMRELESSLAAERDRLAEATARLSVAQRSHDQLADESQRLARLHDELSARCHRLEQAERSAQAALAMREDELRALRRDLDTSKAAEGRGQLRAEGLLGQLATLEASLERERLARRQEASDVGALRLQQAAARQLQTELEHAMSEIAQQRQQLDEYRELHLGLESGLRSAEATLDQLSEARQEDRARAEALRKELERARHALRDRERDLQRIKASSQALRDDLDRARAAIRSEATARRSAEQDASGRARALEEERDALQQTVAQLEQHALELETRWNRFWRDTGVGLATTTPEGRLLACNPVLATWLDVDRLSDASLQLPPVALGEGEVVSRELVLRGPGGEPRPVVEWAVCRRASGETVVDRTFTDMSRLHTLTAELREARRYESVGRLTMRMIDDLGSVVDRLSALARSTSRRGDESVRRDSELPEVAGRAMDLVRQLQQHARRQLRNESDCSVASTAEALLPTLRRIAGEDIEWRLEDLDEHTLGVERHAFEHLLTALALAARESLPEGGCATLTMEPSVHSPRATTEGHESTLLFVAEGYGHVAGSAEGVRAAASRCGAHIDVEASSRASRVVVRFGRVKPDSHDRVFVRARSSRTS